MSPTTVVIIGGGVTGLSTAYHLALKKLGRIIVMDKGPIGDGSSSRAAGIITGLLWSETGVRVRKLALTRYRELSDELLGYRFHDVGCLNWFDRPSWSERATLLPLYDRCGAPYEVLDAKEMCKRWPALKPPEDFIGIYDPRGGYSEPDEYLPALANKCRQMGVEILEHTRVESILTKCGQASGVQAADGTAIEADAVVCASYAWVNQVLENVNIRLPVKSFVHQRYITRALEAPLPKSIPAVNANPLYGYVRPAAGNRLLLGVETADREEWKVESTDFNMTALTTDTRLPQRMMDRFGAAFPTLAGAKLESGRTGLITFSADNEPIIGALDPVDHLYVAVAFHSGGFAYNPAVGMLLAEMIADGEARSADVSAFSPQRFHRIETDKYLSTTVQQKNAARRRH